LWKGIPVNHKRVHRLLQDFHLSLKRTARRPKPNPLLGIVLLAGDKADLRALLLKQREPEPFELLYTDFTLLPYRGGKAWFVPILDHRTRTVVAFGLGPSLQRGWPWGVGGGQGLSPGPGGEAPQGPGAP
jgi:putative transposase